MEKNQISHDAYLVRRDLVVLNGDVLTLQADISVLKSETFSSTANGVSVTTRPGNTTNNAALMASLSTLGDFVNLDSDFSQLRHDEKAVPSFRPGITKQRRYFKCRTKGK